MGASRSLCDNRFQCASRLAFGEPADRGHMTRIHPPSSA